MFNSSRVECKLEIFKTKNIYQVDKVRNVKPYYAYTPLTYIWGGLFLAGNHDNHKIKIHATPQFLPDFNGDETNIKKREFVHTKMSLSQIH